MNPDEESALGKRFSKGLFLTLQDQYKRPLNILEISGGGSYGAFGSGVHVGLAETGTQPKFDIVTGISAGPYFRRSRSLVNPKTMP
jgi:hypothetical protein